MILDRFTARFLSIELDSLILPPGEISCVRGLPGAAPALLAATIRRETGRCVVAIAASPADAEAMFADFEAIGAESRSRYLPQRETLPFENADPHVEISSRRADAFASLLAGRADLIITTARGLIERSAVALEADFGLKLATGDSASRDDLAERLQKLGFESRSSVQELGDFVVRGGIIDVFPFGHDNPLRIEFWDDEIASLRRFDLLTQRSIGRLEVAEILPIVLDPSLAVVDGAWDRRCLLELLLAAPSRTTRLT